jgi:hypothetical protein
MRLRAFSLIAAAILISLIAAPVKALDLAPVKPVTQCEMLAKANIDAAVGAKTQISSASTFHEGAGAGYCRVLGNIMPAVEFEVRLPMVGWTQRYVQTGCGGLCGRLDIHLDKADTCKPALNGEFALASTDMGHEGGMDGSWGHDNYQARIDFAYRGVHVTTLAAKALIERFYGQKARYSYFFGCSDGGREALMEAQRFPADFDGIAAGAPAMNFTTQNSFYHGWNALMNRDAKGQPILTADKLPVLHRAVIEQCDAADGLRDGLISDPAHCHPDLSAIICPADKDSGSCLTAAQVHVATEIYRGAHDATGRGLVIDGPMPGSEINWVGVYVPPLGESRSMSALFAEGTIKNLDSDPNPSSNFSLTDLHFDAASFKAMTGLHGLYDATDTNLAPFQRAGGRLILWHGLADPHISPMNTVAYYEGMRRALGSSLVDEFARLYLFPGGSHCGGGEGPFDFDLVSAMLAWVEDNQAPGALLAGRVPGPQGPPADAPPRGTPPGGPPPGMLSPGIPPSLKSGAAAKVDRTRPVYPYPQIAQYVGHGSVDEAANFQPVAGKAWPINDTWYGAPFFATHEHLWCDGTNHYLECRDSR